MNATDLQETIEFDANIMDMLRQADAHKMWNDFIKGYNIAGNKEAKAIINAFCERYSLAKPDNQGSWLAYAKYALRAHVLGTTYDDPNHDDSHDMWQSNRLDDAQYEQ